MSRGRNQMAPKIDRAKELRAKGLLFREIADEMGVSATMARNYALGLTDRSLIEDEGPLFSCSNFNKELRCKRRKHHRGVHLANTSMGKLIFWETYFVGVIK